MNISQTTFRIGVVLGTIGAMVVLTASAQAAPSKPAGMSQAEYALVVRSEGLNKLYGLDRTSQPAATAQAAPSKPAGMSQAEYALVVRSEGLNKLYGLDRTSQPAATAQAAPSKPAGMSQAEYALMVRSEGLNKLYALDRTSQPTRVVEQPTGSANGFGWGDFGIGAAAMLGLVLLSGGLLAGAYWRKTGVRPRSVS